jgi:hypothetical protein
MKAFSKSILTLLLPALAAPIMHGAMVAQVVSEAPDGAVYERGGEYQVSAGLSLMEGDVLSTNDATVILSFADGSTLTAYPDTILYLSASGELTLGQGEILGDVAGGSSLSVATKVGTVQAQNGVYGVLLNESPDMGWTLQVRNLDGVVAFTGAPKLDTAGMTVSLVEPGKTLNIPAGEEVIVRGIYNESSEVFALVPGGVVMAMLDAEEAGQIREAAQQMSSAVLGDGEAAPGEGDGAPVIIEIPFEDIETASDKG